MGDTVYPGAIDTWEEVYDNLDPVEASHVNDAHARIIAVEQTLGVSPQASYTTVGERVGAAEDRLDALEPRVDTLESRADTTDDRLDALESKYGIIPEPSGGIVHPDWNGVAKAAGTYVLDMSVVNPPAGTVGVYARLTARWDTASTAIVGLRRDASSETAVVVRAADVAVGTANDESGLVACDTNGDITVYVSGDTDYIKIVIFWYVV